jgi:hypothetical protein
MSATLYYLCSELSSPALLCPGFQAVGALQVGHVVSLAPMAASQRDTHGMGGAVEADRLWFGRHPLAVVRFRPVARAEFRALALRHQQPPSFVPPGLDAAVPCTWVAVVDLVRTLDPGAISAEGSIRCRIRTVPIRSRQLQARMADVFVKAVCRQLLAELQLQDRQLVEPA